jgi:hypothetical protein
MLTALAGSYPTTPKLPLMIMMEACLNVDDKELMRCRLDEKLRLPSILSSQYVNFSRPEHQILKIHSRSLHLDTKLGLRSELLEDFSSL